MQFKTCIVLLYLALTLSLRAQQHKLWTADDRKYLIHNLTRTRDSIVAATKNLSEAQWNFKESSDRWSINQVVEHLALWELLLEREITQALTAGPQPELTKNIQPDSTIINFLMEEKQHITTDYTKPFTYTVPLGNNTGANNLTWFLKMRNKGINYVDTTQTDIRYYFLRPGRGDIHQVFITIFAHTDRHLRQINHTDRHLRQINHTDRHLRQINKIKHHPQLSELISLFSHKSVIVLPYRYQ